VVLPVYIVTGFLGAGKTTFLNRLLAKPELAATAVIVNEFGDIGLDHLLVAQSSEGVLELSGGCLCCAVRGDFVDALCDLIVKRGEQITRIVVETSGLADPGPIVQAILGHPVLSKVLRPSGVFCLFDASNDASLVLESPEALSQFAFADVVVLTKVDRSDAGHQAIARQFAIEHAPGARLTQNDRDLAHLFHEQFVPKRFTATAMPHGDGVQAQAICLTADQPVSRRSMDLFIDLLASAHGDNLLRVKGLVKTTETPDKPMLIQGVGRIFSEPAWLPQWPRGECQTRLIVISKGLPDQFIERLFAGFTGGVAPDLPDAAALTGNPLAVPGARF
jgi:G3E family GTPase